MKPKRIFSVKKQPVFNFRKIKNPFYTTCHKYQSEQLVYQEFLILAKLKTYIFFYSNIFFSIFTVDTKLCANKVVISLLIGFHNYSLQQGWKLSDSPFIFALRVSLVKDLYVMVGSIGWMYRSNTSQLHRIVWSQGIPSWIIQVLWVNWKEGFHVEQVWKILPLTWRKLCEIFTCMCVVSVVRRNSSDLKT